LFTSLGSVMFIAGLLPFIRFVALVWFTGNNGGSGRHVQSLVLGSVILIAAVIMFALGVIAELIRINRSLIEDSLEQQKRHFYRRGPDLSGHPGTIDREDGGRIMLGRSFQGLGQFVVADRGADES